MSPLKKEIAELVKRMDVKPSARMRQRILDRILKARKKSVETAKAPRSEKGETGRITDIFLIIPFLVAAVAKAATKTAVAKAATLFVLVSAGAMIYKTVIADPQTRQEQESRVGDASPSDEGEHRTGDKEQRQDLAVGHPITVKLPSSNKVSFSSSARDKTQFNVFGSFGTDIRAFDYNQIAFFGASKGDDLMDWSGGEIALPSVVDKDLHIPDSSLHAIDEGCLDYNLGEISDANGLLTRILSAGSGKIYDIFCSDNSGFHRGYDDPTVAIPAPGSIMLGATGLGALSLAWIRRRHH